MKGNPKHINSREDYLYIKENCDPEFWKPIWKNMLDTRMYWAATDVLDDERKCIVDKTHKFEIMKPAPDSEDQRIKYQQYELQENPNCDMVRFGFTEEEIKNALGSK